MLDLKLIIETKKLIDPYIYETPLDHSIYLSTSNRNIYFKNDGLQHSKSFKLRGAFSKLLRLTEAEKQNGVVAVSSGNHGIAVSYACQVLNIENVLIFVPKNTPRSKTEKIEYYGAKLIIEGDTYDEAHRIGMSYVNDHQMTYVDAYDKDPLIYAGQGTAGLEIMMKHPNIDTILVPVGGGGLITGIGTAAKAINPKIRIIGIQTEACPAMKASMEEKTLYKEYPSSPSLCEALIGGIGELAYEKSQDIIDDVLLVKEETIKKAVIHMISKEKLIIEPSSCTVIAALMDHPEYDFGKETALFLSGSNIDTELMKSLL
ncbi:MAG: threonine/serine dehydratase [Clostridiales bacterium]|nr:threonine/serine dehydratase [Clostridiales bacterium]